MADMNCPYCNAEQDVCHDDGHGYAEDVKHEHLCTRCDGRFVFYTNVSLSYDARPAECLNTGIHYFQTTVTAPKWATKMRCRLCDVERDPSELEKSKYGIPERGAQAKGED